MAPIRVEPPAYVSAEPVQSSPPFMPVVPDGPSRFAASVWILARGGQTAGLLGGQLGASQAGARLTYVLGASRKVALSARIAAPLQGRGREAAFGIDWQPTAAPIHLIAEQRVALDGGRGSPAVFAVGGIGPADIGQGLRVEAYTQVGVVIRGVVEPFGDGATRLTRQVLDLDGTRIDLGIGAWGGAQPGVTRVDAGPSFSVATRAGDSSVRVTLDWRERIGGNANPRSGPALSIGSDF
ncbi:MAG TPA: hypothetical protein VM900_13850 [Sphingomonas sp.]|nr:hypothetical protein [Sphingomonas sp.]